MTNQDYMHIYAWVKQAKEIEEITISTCFTRKSGSNDSKEYTFSDNSLAHTRATIDLEMHTTLDMMK